jgi:molybdopterin-containing oxidoreductase family membrane subunit
MLSLVVNVGIGSSASSSSSPAFPRLPASSWGLYRPTFWDYSTFIGTIGLFLTLLFLFVRFLPMISIFEMRTLVPDAKVEHEI